MPVETFGFIDSLNASNPVGATDPKSQGDDHIRGIKSTLLATFPNVTAAITRTAAQLNNTLVKNEAGNIITAGNVPSSPTLALETTRPVLVFDDTNAAADEGRYYLHSSAGEFALVAINDANSASQTAIRVARTGYNVDRVELQVDGLINLDAVGNGQIILRSAGSTDTENRELLFSHQNGTERGSIGYQGGGILDVVNRVHGSGIDLKAEDAGGVSRLLFSADPDGSSSIYYAGSIRAAALATGSFGVYSDGNTDTETRQIAFNYANGSLRARIGHVGNNSLSLRNMIHGAAVVLTGEDTGGVERNLFTADPDSSATMYNAGNARLYTAASGRVNVRGDDSPGLGGNQAVGFLIEQLDGTDLAALDFPSTPHLRLINLNHGGHLQLQAQDTAGTTRVIMDADPDAATYVRGDTQLILQVAAGAISACSITSDGGIVTPNSEADEFGFKGSPINEQNGNYSLVLTDCGKTIRKVSGGAGETITVPALGTWPLGTIVIIHNDGGGDLTIAQGGLTTLEEWNGSTGNKTLPDNNKAIIEYVGGNAWKYSATG